MGWKEFDSFMFLLGIVLIIVYYTFDFSATLEPYTLKSILLSLIVGVWFFLLFVFFANLGLPLSHNEKHEKLDRFDKEKKSPLSKNLSTSPDSPSKQQQSSTPHPQSNNRKRHASDHKESAERIHFSQKRKKTSTKDSGKKTASMEDRLEYYKKKYGDNFKVKSDTASQRIPATSSVPETGTKKSLFKRIAGFFKKNKS